MNIRFLVNVENGEAKISPACLRELEDIMEHSPLFAADILKDISYDAAALYKRSLKMLRASSVKQRAAAMKRDASANSGR